MTALTTTQRAAVERVRAAKDVYLAQRASAREELRIAIEERVQASQAAMDAAVRAAYELGVPKRQIGLHGLGTTDPAAANKSLARTEGLVLEAPTVERFTTGDWHEWWPDEIRLVHVRMAGPDWDSWLEANRDNFGVGVYGNHSHEGTAFWHPAMEAVQTIENDRPSAAAIWYPVDAWIRENASETVRALSDQRAARAA